MSISARMRVDPQRMTTGFWGLRGRQLAGDFLRDFHPLNPLGLFNHGRNCWLDPPPLRESCPQS
jgi:hypothetical protein